MSNRAAPEIKLLLVDDRSENLAALEAVLAPLGHTLVAVTSGEEALRRLLRDEEFALILLDVMMPGMDGFETAARIKQRERTRDVPIVFLTAVTDDVGHAMRGFSSGAVDFITKPFESWLLVAKVKVFVDLFRKNQLLLQQRELLARRLDEHLVAEARQLRKLAEAALAISAARALDEMLQMITDQARLIIGAHQAEIHAQLFDGEATAVSNSEKYTAWRSEGRQVDLAPVHELVYRQQRSVRMTRRDVTRHPALHAFSEEASGHPLLGGWIAVPLTGRNDRRVGLIQVADKISGDFTDRDEAILVQLAQMASVAVEKAELYHREHLIAETLQRSLLPADLPVVPGVRLATRYLPGSAGAEVGGDWYDAVALGDGQLAITIGDVAGRGINAAAVMGQVRIAMRAYGLQGLAPGEVIAGVNRLMYDLSDFHLATAIFLRLDPRTGAVRFVNAGHPPPVLLGAGGKTELLEGGLTQPLNVGAVAEYEEFRLTLEPGSTLLLYTDGLIEERRESLDEGLCRLQEAVQTNAGEPEQLCDGILDALGAAKKNDDVAMLAIRFEGLG